MTKQELTREIINCLDNHSTKKYTGQLIFTVDMRQGGIGNAGVEIKQRDPNFGRNGKKFAQATKIS